MQVLITGSERGQLYWELQRTVPKTAHIFQHAERLDIADADAVNACIEIAKPDVIINAAAYTQVDKAEADQEAAYAVNEIGTINLAKAARAANAHLVHVSTDFVFGQSDSRPFQTDARVDPISIYGKSKLAGEQALTEILPQSSATVRTAWVYSSHGNNFVKTMLRLMKERGEVGVIADQVGAPTWAHSLAQALWRAADIRATGVMHWTGAGAASWYDFAQAIMEEGVALGLLDKPATINPLTTEQYPTPAARPSYSLLSLGSTWDALDMQAAHWRVELRNMMGELV